MSKYLKYIFTLIVIFWQGTMFSFAQDYQQSILEEAIDSVDVIFERLSASNNDAESQMLNSYIKSYLDLILQEEESFDLNLDTLGNLSVVTASNGKLKIYTWNICYQDGTHNYFGYLQRKNKRNIDLFTLEDFSNDTSKNRSFVSHKEWYGALYYQIIVKKWDKKVFYTLVGWDGADMFTNRKVIETLQFTRKGLPEFGIKKFRNERKKTGRIMFEYSEKSTMLLRYNENHDMIIIDHLASINPRFQNQTQYYAPDFTYDAYEYKAGRWWFLENIDPEKAINYKKNRNIEKIKNKRFSSDF